MSLEVRGRLLVLDDDVTVGTMLGDMAMRVGLDVRVATDATTFFDIEATWQPTHIAIDLIMPDFDGVQVMRRLARQRCRAAIIITSGAGTRVVEAAKRASVERGLKVLGILSKPFTLSGLRNIIHVAGPDVANATMAGSPVIVQAPGDICHASLLAGLEAKQLRTFFQPKISGIDGQVAGFEALVRWQHPQYGLIGPQNFVPLAEVSGLIHELTFQVLDLALSWFGRHFADGEAKVSVNLSPRSLHDVDLANQISNTSRSHGVYPGRVILEVTETSAMSDPLSTLDLLTSLRIKGFQVSIDDFGIGYSSMAQLARLPFSEMKIDQSFVKELAHSEDSQKIVRGIIGLGHSLGIGVTAEGVEDVGALNYLKANGCDLVQGFLIGKPMEGEEALDWVEAYGHPSVTVK